MTSFFLILPRHAYFPVYGGAVRSNGTHRDDDSLLRVSGVQVQKINFDNIFLGIHLIK